jgi:anti-sigma regulatory factor (Ser/Thr protein kinase)
MKQLEVKTRDAGRRAPAVVLVLPSDASFLGLVRDVTKKMAEGAGFEAAIASQVAHAVEEATASVLERAYRGRPDRMVELHFEDRGPEFCVDVMDEGAALDPRTLPKVDRALDSVTFTRTAHRNRCRMVKRKAKAEHESP